jgi:hypothetical protein
METMVLDRGRSTYLINAARLVRDDDLADLAKRAQADWSVSRGSPFITWIAGDYAEADRPNSNTQYWTAGDLEMAEYTIRYAPLNMAHKVRQPIGFYAATQKVALTRDEASQESLKISALSGLWNHIFPFEAAQAEAADDAGLLFYSMECRGTHLICGTDEARGLQGCGEKFDYMKVDTHCQHLLDRSSVRHIVNPTFRGGALIVPPMKPGWKNAHARVLDDAVRAEAASFAEANEAAYEQRLSEGADLSPAAWEQLMTMAVATAKS